MTMARVGCAGILVADTFCGPVAALPQPGELLQLDDMPVSAGGCAANVAIGLARQDIDVEVAGCAGNDAAGDSLVLELQHAGVQCGRIVRSRELPTSKTVVLLVSGEDRRYLHNFGANAAFGAGDIDRDWAMSLQVFYIGGLFALPRMSTSELASLLAECREAGVVTVVDVVVPRGGADARALDPLLPHIDYFLPNEDEARIFTGADEPLDQISSLRARGARNIIITRGAEGCLAAGDEQAWRVPAHRLTAIDPSGSGDAFTAGIITGIVRGWDLPRTLPYASTLGASAARAIGTTNGVFRGDEADAFLQSHPLDVMELRWK